jgi:RNA polymerase sigma-70 factor (sigma-E family)
VDEPVGFREYVKQRSPALLRSASLLTGDPATAEDLVQTALAKVWPRWTSIRADNPDAYVRRVMVTTFATWWRRRWRAEVPTGVVPDLPPGSGPWEAIDSREVLRRSLAALPRRQRAVVVLRFYEDLSEAGAAEVLGCSVGTVKSQCARALAKLRLHPGLAELVAEEVHQ